MPIFALVAPQAAVAITAVPAPPPRPRAEESLSPDQAATPAGGRVVALINKLQEDIVTTRYQGPTVVDRKAGLYAWDCSGMASWILQRAAPRAKRTVGKGRQRAKDFYRAITKAPVGKARRGWQRLEHVSEAKPGDVFAFLRSPLSRSKITGHVGFLVEEPWPVEGMEGAWAARIVDATGLPHEDDTRDYQGEGGFGFGTFLFVTDDSGKAIAYGWFGTRSTGYLPTEIVFGRVTR